jgi:Ca2+-binding EF-hand superfamily protein
MRASTKSIQDYIDDTDPSLLQTRKLFSYKDFIKTLEEDWKIEVVDIFRIFDENCEGVLPYEEAVRALELIGIDGKLLLNPNKKMVPIKVFIEEISDFRGQNDRNSEKRWTYIFRLIAGSEKGTITVENLQDFFRRFGHVPDEKYCEDFIDEFDRNWLTKTEVNLQDWLMFCRLNRLPF